MGKKAECESQGGVEERMIEQKGVNTEAMEEGGRKGGKKVR